MNRIDEQEFDRQIEEQGFYYDSYWGKLRAHTFSRSMVVGLVITEVLLLLAVWGFQNLRIAGATAALLKAQFELAELQATRNHEILESTSQGRQLATCMTTLVGYENRLAVAQDEAQKMSQRLPGNSLVAAVVRLLALLKGGL